MPAHLRTLGKRSCDLHGRESSDLFPSFREATGLAGGNKLAPPMEGTKSEFDEFYRNQEHASSSRRRLPTKCTPQVGRRQPGLATRCFCGIQEHTLQRFRTLFFGFCTLNNALAGVVARDWIESP